MKNLSLLGLTSFLILSSFTVKAEEPRIDLDDMAGYYALRNSNSHKCASQVAIIVRKNSIDNKPKLSFYDIDLAEEKLKLNSDFQAKSSTFASDGGFFPFVGAFSRAETELQNHSVSQNENGFALIVFFPIIEHLGTKIMLSSDKQTLTYENHKNAYFVYNSNVDCEYKRTSPPQHFPNESQLRSSFNNRPKTTETNQSNPTDQFQIKITKLIPNYDNPKKKNPPYAIDTFMRFGFGPKIHFTPNIDQIFKEELYTEEVENPETYFVNLYTTTYDAAMGPKSFKSVIADGKSSFNTFSNDKTFCIQSIIYLDKKTNTFRTLTEHNDIRLKIVNRGKTIIDYAMYSNFNTYDHFRLCIDNNGVNYATSNNSYDQ